MNSSLAACLAFTVCFLLLLAHLTIGGQKAIELSLRPSIAFAPASVQVRIRIQPDESDRWVALEFQSEDFYRRSDWSVEGARVLYSWIQPDLPAGEYQVTAALGHGEIIRARDVKHLVVQGTQNVSPEQSIPLAFQQF